MKQSLKMILTLTIIATLSGIMLAKVYEITEPKIKAKEKELIEESIFTVVPETTKYQKESYNGIDVFKCFDKNQKVCGFAFTAEGVGYQDIIKIMVGVNADLSEIKGVKILDDKETPGLGSKINDESFRKQFQGLSLKADLELVKDRANRKNNQIQAITGATISSEAIVDIINKKVEEIKRVLNE